MSSGAILYLNGPPDVVRIGDTFHMNIMSGSRKFHFAMSHSAFHAATNAAIALLTVAPPGTVTSIAKARPAIV